MKDEKIINVIQPTITSYNTYAHLLAIMEASYGNTESFHNWFINQYLILKGFRNNMMATFIFDDPFNENRIGCRFVEPAFIPFSFIKKNNIDIIKFIKDMISDNYAVHIWLDQFYLPLNAEFYKKHHFVHDPMIYGYINDDFLLADFYGGEKYNLNNLVGAQYIRDSFYENKTENFETTKNINNQLVVCVRPRSFMEYEYDHNKLKYVINKHLSGFSLKKGYKQDFEMGINCYDLFINFLLTVPKTIDLGSCHVFYDHKVAAYKTVEYLLETNKINQENDLKKNFNKLREHALIARNLAMKYNLSGSKELLDKIVNSYIRLKKEDIDCFEKLYNIL